MIFDSIFDSVFDLIFDSRSSNSTSIHQFYNSASTQLRSPTFNICLDDESRARPRFADIWMTLLVLTISILDYSDLHYLSRIQTLVCCAGNHCLWSVYLVSLWVFSEQWFIVKNPKYLSTKKFIENVRKICIWQKIVQGRARYSHGKPFMGQQMARFGSKLNF